MKVLFRRMACFLTPFPAKSECLPSPIEEFGPIAAGAVTHLLIQLSSCRILRPEYPLSWRDFGRRCESVRLAKSCDFTNAGECRVLIEKA
jgi:hypothetical protein